MAEIEATTESGQLQEALADWAEGKAAPLVTEINADLVTLDGSPTNAQVIAIVRRGLVRQRKVINGVVKLVKRNGL